MKFAKDFSSKAFWDERFITEQQFEWLANADVLAELAVSILIQESFPKPVNEATILHIGSGTSNLCNSLRRNLVPLTPPNRIVNLDYAPLAIERGKDMEKQEFGNVEMEWCVADLLQWNPLQKSLLEISSLAMNNQAPFFDIMLEKGCADAISCGEHVVVDLEGTLVSLEPVGALMANLARIMRIGGTLLSLSYSKYRYDFLKPDSETFIESLAKLWRVVECKNVKPEAEQSSQAEERTHVVYEPEVFHTIFVLERIGL